MSKSDAEVEKQRAYYAQTAGKYEAMHGAEPREHAMALGLLVGLLPLLGVRSVLDVGAGTGRNVRALKQQFPELRVLGVEPVPELRAVGHEAGLGEDELRVGDATRLDFADGEFDCVCEFGVLHHIPKPERAVREMFRVARKAVLISDSNNFGQGGRVGRAVKQTLDALRLWPLADLLKTRGRGYTESEGDGIAYSYSVFNNYKLIRSLSRSVHVLNTEDGGINPYRSASHVALLALK